MWLNNIPSPVIASGPPARPDLMKIVSCQCRAAGKACSQANCSCLTTSLSCTTYCQCEGSLDQCHNPMTARDGDSAIINDAEEKHSDFDTDLLEY